MLDKDYETLSAQRLLEPIVQYMRYKINPANEDVGELKKKNLKFVFYSMHDT